MSLYRTATFIRLRSTDTFWYNVPMADKGDGVVIPEADSTVPFVGLSNDDYVAVMCADDGQVYRWSLESMTVDGLLYVNHLVTLSPDQSETSLPGVDILLGSTWYRVKVSLQEDVSGVLVPSLIVDPGSPWVVLTGNGGRGRSTFQFRGPFNFFTFGFGMNYEITPGDTGSPMTFIVGDKDGPWDLTGATVVFRYLVNGSPVDKAVTADQDQVANKGVAIGYWGATELDNVEAGNKACQAIVTFSDGSVRKTPPGYATFTVREAM